MDLFQPISPRTQKRAAGLMLLLLLACWLRLDAAGWGLPFRLHPDEWKYAGGAGKIHQTGEWNPKYFRNPPGLTYTYTAWYPLWMAVRPPVEIPAWLNLNPFRMQPSQSIEATYLYRPFDLVLGARVLTALFGAASLIWVFWIAKEFFPARAAFLAASIFAVSFLSVRDSHFAVNDAPVTFWILLSSWLALLAYRLDRRALWLAAAATAGIAVVFKYNAFPCVLLVLGLLFLRQKQKGPRFDWRAYIKHGIILGSLSVLVFLVICPFPLLDPAAFWGHVLDQAQKNTAEWIGQKNTWSGFLLVDTLQISEGWLACGFALLGAAACGKKRMWPLFIFPGLYLFLILAHSLFFARFAIPLLPWIAIFAAAGIHFLAGRFHLSPIIVLLLGLACIAEPLVKDIRGNYLLKQENTRVTHLRWFMTQVEEPVLMTAGMFGMPFVYRDVAEPWAIPLDPRIVLMDKLASSDLSQLDTLSQYPIRYVTISSFATFPGYLPETYAERRSALMQYAGAEQAYKTINPYKTPWEPRPGDIEDTYSPIRNLWQRNQPGPAIEIFRKE